MNLRTTALGKVLGPNGPVEEIVGKNYVDIENDHGETLRYRKHANGRGLIAHGAKVHPTAIVEAGAYVEPGVQIAAGARIGRGVWIESDALIGPEVVVAPHAHIGDRRRLQDRHPHRHRRSRARSGRLASRRRRDRR